MVGKETVNKNNVFGNTWYGEKVKKKFLFNIICCTSASREDKISLQTGYNPYRYSKWNYQTGKDHMAVKIKV